MSGNTNREYWDTCVFLAYIRKEKHRIGEFEEIESRVKLFEQGAISLFTSAITITEIYEAARFNDHERNIFSGICKRTNFQFIDANRNICELASEIRSYFKLNPPKSNLYPTASDAIQVASAIALRKMRKVDLELVTLDSDNKPKELAFIEMAPYIQSQYGVIITRPTVPPIFRSER